MTLCSACPSGMDVSITATIIVSDPVAIQATTVSQDATGAGTVPAGASSMSFFNYGPAVVTVGGIPLKKGAAIMYPFLGRGVTYGPILYDATGSTLRIDRTIL